jgi:hypothetical protein
MRWAGYVIWMEETRNSNIILIGKPEEKGSVGRPRWVDVFKWTLKK